MDTKTDSSQDTTSRVMGSLAGSLTAEEAFKAKVRKKRSFYGIDTGLSQRQYSIIVSKVMVAKLNKTHKRPSDHIILKKYDVLENGDEKRLIVPESHSSNIIYYVHDDELYQILLKTHLDFDHAGRDKMMKELKRTYKNVSYKDVVIFLSMCKECREKGVHQNKEVNERSCHFNFRCQIDLIDYHSHPDGEFNTIMVYQELFTKFSLLKPLKSSSPEEVADNLINIFGILGPPALLQSNCEDDCLEQIINVLKISWPSLDIGRIKNEKRSGASSQEVENMVTSWMRNNNNSRWSDGLRFVQLKRNTVVNPEINKTPYEALFKYTPKTGSNEEAEGDNDEEEISEVTYKEEPADEDDYDDEGGAIEIYKNEVKEEEMEITKSEPSSICEQCGHEREEFGSCANCNANRNGT